MDPMNIQVEPLDLRVKKKTDTIASLSSSELSLLPKDTKKSKHCFMENKTKNIFPHPYLCSAVEHKFCNYSAQQDKHAQIDYFQKQKSKVYGTSQCSKLPSLRFLLNSTSSQCPAQLKYVNEGSYPTFSVEKPATDYMKQSAASENLGLHNTIRQDTTTSSNKNTCSPSFLCNTWIPSYGGTDKSRNQSSNARLSDAAIGTNSDSFAKYLKSNHLETGRNYVSTGFSNRTFSQVSVSESDMLENKVSSSYTVTVPQALPFTALKEEKRGIANNNASFYDRFKDINNNNTGKVPLRRIAPKQYQNVTPPVVSWCNPSVMQDAVLSPASKGRRFDYNPTTQIYQKTSNRNAPVIQTSSQGHSVTMDDSTALKPYYFNKELSSGFNLKKIDDNNNDHIHTNANMEQDVIGIQPGDHRGKTTWPGCLEALPQKTAVTNTYNWREKPSQLHDVDKTSHFMTCKNINIGPTEFSGTAMPSLVPDKQNHAGPWIGITSKETLNKPKYYFMNKFTKTSDEDDSNQTYDEQFVKSKKISPCIMKDESLDSGNDTDSDDTWNYSEEFEKWMNDIDSLKGLEHIDCKDVNTEQGIQRGMYVDRPMPRRLSVEPLYKMSQDVNIDDAYVHKKKKFSYLNSNYEALKKERTGVLPVLGGLGVKSPSDLHQCHVFYWCHCCEKSFKNEHDARVHYFEHGNGDINLERYYLQVYGQVTKHWKGFNKEGRCVYLCGLCDQAMLYTQGFRWHILTHGKGHRCHKCNKPFLSRKKLTEHQNYGCDTTIKCCCTCGRKFSSSKHMKIHAHVHSRARPSSMYSCSYCGKTLSSRGSLTTHTRLHTGNNPYMCNLCGRSYPQNVQLKLHMKVHRKKDSQ